MMVSAVLSVMCVQTVVLKSLILSSVWDASIGSPFRHRLRNPVCFSSGPSNQRTSDNDFANHTYDILVMNDCESNTKMGTTCATTTWNTNILTMDNANIQMCVSWHIRSYQLLSLPILLATMVMSFLMIVCSLSDWYENCFLIVWTCW